MTSWLFDQMLGLLVIQHQCNKVSCKLLICVPQPAQDVASSSRFSLLRHKRFQVTQKCSLRACMTRASCKSGASQSYLPWSTTGTALRSQTCKWSYGRTGAAALFTCKRVLTLFLKTVLGYITDICQTMVTCSSGWQTFISTSKNPKPSQNFKENKLKHVCLIFCFPLTVFCFFVCVYLFFCFFVVWTPRGTCKLVRICVKR